MKRILAVIFTLLVAFTASAQVIQPTYTRQSKGATITLFTNVTATTESAIFDMAPYSGLQVFATFPAGPSTCSGFIQVFGSGEKNPNTFDFTNFDQDGSFFVNNPVYPVSYTLSNVPQFIKIRYFKSVFSCSGITVKVTPIPFPNTQQVSGSISEFDINAYTKWPVLMGGRTFQGDSRMLSLDTSANLLMKPGGYPSTGYLGSAIDSPVAVNGSGSGANQIFLATPTQYATVNLQNVGAQDILCGFLPTTSATEYAFRLYAKTAAYLPNVYTVNALGAFSYDTFEYREEIYCVSTNASAASVAISAY